MIAVIPFRVTGADTALAEGVAEVLAGEFTGEGVPRAADPSAVWHAWRGLGGRPGTPLTQAVALRLAAQVGAGQVLIGSVATLGGRRTFNASILNVPGGTVRSRAEPVSGPADSLPAMIRRLTTNLLAGSDARVIQRIGKAGTSSPEAMRAYMAGSAAFRRGVYGQARQQFARATELDSTFALAALGGIVELVVGPPRMQRLAWSLRDRLSASNRALLVAYLGPNYPNASPIAQRLVALETAAAAFPDSPELLYKLGDTYHHYGRALGFTDGLERANAVLRRSISVDSMLSASLLHLVFSATALGDRAGVRQYAERLLRDTTAEILGHNAHWQVAVATGTARAVDGALEYLERTRRAADIAFATLLDSTGMANADRLLAAGARTASTDAERLLVRTATSNVERTRGRPGAAHAAVSGPAFGPDVDGVYEWLYGDGDSTSANGTVRLLQTIADAPPATAPADRERQDEAVCVLEQWRLWQGDTATAQRAIDRLSSAAAPLNRATVEEMQLCATALAALRAVRANRPDADARISALDSALWAGQNVSAPNHGPRIRNNRARFTLLLALLREIRGDVSGALRTVRRRYYNLAYPWVELFSASLREEGRLAARAGDRDGAINAYRWYLTLVTDPEPSVAPTRDRVRAELARLERERRR